MELQGCEAQGEGRAHAEVPGLSLKHLGALHALCRGRADKLSTDRQQLEVDCAAKVDHLHAAAGELATGAVGRRRCPRRRHACGGLQLRRPREEAVVGLDVGVDDARPLHRMQCLQACTSVWRRAHQRRATQRHIRIAGTSDTMKERQEWELEVVPQEFPAFAAPLRSAPGILEILAGETNQVALTGATTTVRAGAGGRISKSTASTSAPEHKPDITQYRFRLTLCRESFPFAARQHYRTRWAYECTGEL